MYYVYAITNGSSSEKPRMTGLSSSSVTGKKEIISFISTCKSYPIKTVQKKFF